MRDDAVAMDYDAGMAHGSPARTAELAPALIDLAHLARQTFGDATLQRDVLKLFADQAAGLRRTIRVEADPERRGRLCHLLKGGALGIGAFPLADMAEMCEASPSNRDYIAALDALIGQTLARIEALAA